MVKYNKKGYRQQARKFVVYPEGASVVLVSGYIHSMYIAMDKGMSEPICWVCFKIYT